MTRTQHEMSPNCTVWKLLNFQLSFNLSYTQAKPHFAANVSFTLPDTANVFRRKRGIGPRACARLRVLAGTRQGRLAGLVPLSRHLLARARAAGFPSGHGPGPVQVTHTLIITQEALAEGQELAGFLQRGWDARGGDVDGREKVEERRQ